MFTIVLWLCVCMACAPSCLANCGEPGHSKNTAPSPEFLRDDKMYPEGHEVEYSCDHPLVGWSSRSCKSGRWTNPIPKCPEVRNVTDFVVRGAMDKNIYISWKNKARVVGLQLGLRRPSNSVGDWPDIGILRVDNLGKIYSNIEDGPSEDIKIARISLTYSNVRQLLKSNRLVVKTNMTFSRCQEFGDTEYVSINRSTLKGTQYICLDDKYHELYHLDETIDGCSIPDSPLHSTAESERSERGVNSTYECHEGYRLKANVLRHAPFCLPNGDWTSYDFKPCDLITCDIGLVLPASVVLFSQPLLNSGNQVPIGTKAYLKCSTPDNERYLICRVNGQWSENKRPCPGEETSSSTTQIVVGAVAVFLIVICLLAVGLFLRGRNRHDSRGSMDMRGNGMNSKDIGSNLNIVGQSVRYAPGPSDVYEPGFYENTMNPEPFDAGDYISPQGSECYYVTPASGSK